jgi:hypothetical protein
MLFPFRRKSESARSSKDMVRAWRQTLGVEGAARRRTPISALLPTQRAPRARKRGPARWKGMTVADSESLDPAPPNPGLLLLPDCSLRSLPAKCGVNHETIKLVLRKR